MMNGPTIVHVTHESAYKIGGIGAVLEGFFTSTSYLEFAGRSIIAGPLFDRDMPASKRLGPGGSVLHSGLDGIINSEHSADFHNIENTFNTPIVYGTKTFIDSQSGIESCQEVVLVDVTHMHARPANDMKKKLFEQFGIRSDLHEYIWEYEQYVRLATVMIPIMQVLGTEPDSTIIASHEWMGMPTALAGLCEYENKYKTVFYAHEVATVRKILEDLPGHDAAFYKALSHANEQGKYIADVFGDQAGYFKHQLVEASQYCDAICAVGDYTAKELRFLAKGFEEIDIKVVYNGVPAYETSMEQKIYSKNKLQQYCENLLGYKPDYIFSHVTRLVTSKGLWRDLEILELIDKKLQEENKLGVMYLLSTQAAQRPPEYIVNMESAYGWPVAHREGWPDMNGGETEFYSYVQRFNARSRNVKAVFINQFGFDQKLCGGNVPKDTSIVDLRRGTDVEFGLSTYEPFGISHLEPLTYGGICVLSSVCGCAGLVKDQANEEELGNVIIADYVEPAVKANDNNPIDEAALRKIEQPIAEVLADEICARLPRTQHQVAVLMNNGYKLAQKMSWETVLSTYVLPTMEAVLQQESCGKNLNYRLV